MIEEQFQAVPRPVPDPTIPKAAALVTWPLWLGLGFLILVLIWTQLGLLTGSRPRVARIGSAAPEMILARLEDGRPGPRSSLSAYKGHPVLLNFWATWCAACREEFAAFQAKYDKYKDSKQLVVIGVDSQGDLGVQPAQEFVSGIGSTFPIWLDVDGSAEQAFRVDALPTTVLIDRAGVVRDIVIGGPMSEEYLEKELEKIF